MSRRGSATAAVAAAAALLCAAAGQGLAHGAPRDERLAAVEDFTFAIGIDANRQARIAGLEPYDLVIVDGELTARATVAQLRDQGSIVLAYLSVGTIEPFRSWYRLLKPYRLRSRFEEFDEYYANLRAPRYRRLIRRRIAPRILRKGFDGLFLDNTDMVEGHPRQHRGMRKLVRSLAGLVHGRGDLLFAQNGEGSIGPLLRFYDGWNREDVTWTYDFDRRRYVHRRPGEVARAIEALENIGEAGLLVTATDYTAAGDTSAFEQSVANACAAGALPFVSNIALTRIPAVPPGCS
jgi:endo-alpha-1,4-polygalactosaminidase (GH114 family)